MKELNKAGFWIRLLAMWIDLLVVYAALKLIYYLLLILPVTLYFPFEFVFLLVLFVYSVCMTYWKGYTLGKWLLNLTVVSSKNNKLPVIRIILRETILKILSASVLFLGFFWIGFSKKKQGWHDLIVHSNVRKSGDPTIVNHLAKYTGLALFLLLFGNYVYGLYDTYDRSKAFESTKKIDFPYMTRDAKDVTEIAQLPMSNDTLYENWLVKNGKSPEDYIVDIASKHQVTLIGEMHGIKDNLDFFNKVIPNLYHTSGVRCIALECLPRTMNRKIEKLVNNDTFDSDLALTIARSQPWRVWGSKEYWDVLETVWRLNKSIADKADKMSVVGIDEDWEGPYFAYLSLGDDKLENVPMVEKLKAPFIMDDFAKMINREELMAYNIEKEIIKKNKKGVVWIGSAHVPTRFGRPFVQQGKIIAKPRMGALIWQKYGNKVFPVVIYQNMRLSDTSCFNSFIERIMDKSGSNGCAFSSENSPFAMLRDNGSDLFNLYPTIAFQDICEGFIYLNPISQMRKCTWTKDYISKEMFMKYRPFYECKVNSHFSNAEQINMFMNEQ